MTMVETIVVPATPAEQFDPCFLTAQTIDDYLRFASSEDPDDPRFAIFSTPADWSEKDRFPLALCEFLAYKSVLSYEDDEKIAKHLTEGKRRGIDVTSYKFFDSGKPADGSKGTGDTQGYGFVMGETAFIIMRGSAGLKDWIADVTATLTEMSFIPGETAPLPKRHLGFARAWASVASQIEPWAEALPANVRQFCFSGHSLGGALAIIGAYEFTRREIGKGREVAAVVTFAAPKVGGKEFAEQYDAMLRRRTLRLESNEDAVPWLAISPDYTQVGISCPLDKRPMIAGWEKVWAALLFIAGWTKAKATATKDTRSTRNPEVEEKPKAGENASVAKPGTVSEGAKPSTQVDGKTALLAIVIIVAVVVVVLTARGLVIRYRAHSAAKRYALYLSTLSYRKIRELRIQGGASYKDAFEDHKKHLGYIRGDGTIYTSLQNRPVAALTTQMATELDRLTQNGAPYEAYIW